MSKYKIFRRGGFFNNNTQYYHMNLQQTINLFLPKDQEYILEENIEYSDIIMIVPQNLKIFRFLENDNYKIVVINENTNKIQYTRIMEKSLEMWNDDKIDLL